MLQADARTQVTQTRGIGPKGWRDGTLHDPEHSLIASKIIMKIPNVLSWHMSGQDKQPTYCACISCWWLSLVRLSLQPAFCRTHTQRTAIPHPTDSRVFCIVWKFKSPYHMSLGQPFLSNSACSKSEHRAYNRFGYGFDFHMASLLRPLDITSLSRKDPPSPRPYPPVPPPSPSRQMQKVSNLMTAH